MTRDAAVSPVSPRPAARLALRRALPLVAAGLLAYANARGIPFLYDDLGAIVQNPDIRRLWPPSWALPSAAAHAPVNSRPVVGFTLALNYALGGLDPDGYRLANLGIHVLCALLLQGVVRRTLQSRRVAPLLAPHAEALALATALLWLLHPLNTQVVDYTIQRSESLMALFFLGSLYAVIRRLESGRRAWAVAAMGAAALGMASKETMAVAPPLILLYDRTFHAGSLAVAWRQHRRLYLGLAATYLLLAALMAGRPHGRTIGFATEVGAGRYAANQAVVVLDYLVKAFWPHPLVIDYGYPASLSAARVLPAALVLATLLGLGLWAVLRHPPAGFPAAWCFAILAPTSSFIPIVNEVGAERRMYLPLAGLLALAVVGLYLLTRRSGWPRGLAVAGLVAVSIALGALTVARNAQHRQPVELWRTAVSARPHNPRGHTYLGMALKERGRTQEAVAHYRTALQLDPAYPEAHANLGILLAVAGRVSQAIAHFRQALAGYPEHAEMHNNLGSALLASGQVEAAVASFQAALALQPEYADAHSNLGSARGMEGRTDEALGHFRRALAIDGTHFRAYYNLGLTHLNAGRPDSALPHLRRALELQPGSAAVQQGLQAALRAAQSP
ncbi:MAG: tetratricopeptide repeat protein [Candidatus Latescibacterota bacterium]